MVKVNSNQLEYIKSLSSDELRYELDKVYARLKEIQMFAEIRKDMPSEFLMDSLSVLDKDYKKLMGERELLEEYYNKLR